MQSTTQFEDWAAILKVLNLYADLVDFRDWSIAEQVFTEDATGSYTDGVVSGRDTLIAFWRAHFDGCGPTQHLFGNYTIEVEGDQARASCRGRMFHMGAGTREGVQYESFGRYNHVLVRTPDGWRIKQLTLKVGMRHGDRSVLQPG